MMLVKDRNKVVFKKFLNLAWIKKNTNKTTEHRFKKKSVLQTIKVCIKLSMNQA